MLSIYRLLAKLKETALNALIVCGGAHATIAYQEVLDKGFDLSIIGEGEETFREVVDTYIESGCKLKEELFLAIKGIVFKNSGGGIQKTAKRELIDDLDAIGHPARYLLNNKAYHKRYYVTRGMNTYGVYTLHGARGCPYECIFCCVNFGSDKKLRFHSPSYIADEVSILVNKYKAKWIFFTDDTFFLNKPHTEAVCNLLIDRMLHKKVKWEVQIRSNLIKPDDLALLKLMKKAGCRQIDIGFESGNQRLLTLIKGQGITLADHLRAIDLIKEAGLTIMGTFILGTPSETYSEMADTVSFIKTNIAKIDRFQMGYMIPYPGTKLYQLAKERGIIGDNYLATLRREEEMGLSHGEVSYSDLISQAEVRKVRIELDSLSVKRVNILEKFKWLLYNITHSPRIVFGGCAIFLKRTYQECLERRK